MKPITRRKLLQQGITAALGVLIAPRLFSFNIASIMKRSIPSSGEIIPIIGLGTWQSFDVGSNASERAALKEVLRALVAAGASVVDSSPMYGSSEEVVGDLTTELSIRQKLFLATKVWTSGKQESIAQMNRSFSRMQTSVMDLMQVHNLLDVQTHLKTLRDWKAEKKIRYIGITHYTVSAYPSLIQLIQKEKPDFVQFNYNIQVREAEKYLLAAARDQGVAVIINRPFEEGALFQKVKGKSLPSWAKEYEIESWGQFFLKYIISHEAVTCVIPGTANVRHLEDNLKSASGNLPDNTGRKRMAAYFDTL